jgi:hypothetical protein
MKTHLSLGVLASMIAACGGSPAVDSLSALTSVPTASIEVDVFRNTNGKLAGFVYLGTWSHAAYSDPQVCPVLPADTVVTVNGKPLRAISLGTFDGTACYVPQWEDDDASDFSAASLDVKITNSTGSLEASFVNVTVPRTFTVTSPSNGVVHAGDTVTVELSPSTDQLEDNDAMGIVMANFDHARPTSPTATWIDPAEGLSVCTACANTTVKGSTATFVVPANAVGSTTAHLAEVGLAGVAKCSVAHCDLEIATQTNEVALTVQ